MSAGTHLGIVGCIIAAARVPGTAVAQSVALADSALVRPIRAAVSHAGPQSDADADPVKNGVIVGALCRCGGRGRLHRSSLHALRQ